MADTNARGRFVWYELLTTDPDAAKDFYSAVTGWNTESWEGLEQPYTMWMSDHGPVGGVMELPEEARAGGAPPHLLPYVAAPDADATIEKATSAGGNVLFGPLDLPEVGRVAVLQDPQSAVFAILEPAGDAPGHEGDAREGEFSWNELATTDLDGAMQFYRELFGWDEAEPHDMGPEMGPYRMFGKGDRTFIGAYRKPDDMPAPPHWLCYTHVTDLDGALDTVKARGGQVVNGPMEVPGGDRVAVCLDPQGAAFALHARGTG